MFYILHGQDDFSLREALEGIKASLGEPEALATSTTLLAGPDLTLKQLTSACDSLPFLAPKHLVIVEGLLSRFEGRAGESRRRSRPQPPELAEWRALKGYIPSMPPTTILVLTDGRLAKGNPLLVELAPLATVREFPLLKRVSLLRWIEEQVARRKAAISPAATRLLADTIGGNLWVMASEVEKLCLYAKGRRIEESDVRAVVSYVQETNIFNLCDAIMEGKASLATSLLHRLFDSGAVSAYILVMITRQFRMLIQAKELAARRVSQGEIGARLGLRSDFAMSKVASQAQGYPMERLEQVYRSLLETDIAIKMGKVEGDLALDLLVANLCQMASPSPHPSLAKRGPTPNR